MVSKYQILPSKVQCGVMDKGQLEYLIKVYILYDYWGWGSRIHRSKRASSCVCTSRKCQTSTKELRQYLEQLQSSKFVAILKFWNIFTISYLTVMILITYTTTIKQVTTVYREASLWTYYMFPSILVAGKPFMWYWTMVLTMFILLLGWTLSMMCSIPSLWSIMKSI